MSVLRTVKWDRLDAAARRELMSRPAVQLTPEIDRTVRELVAEVRRDGDEALRRLSARFDGAALDALEVAADDCAAAWAALPRSQRDAIDRAARNIDTFHAAQRRPAVECEVMGGVRCWLESRPIERVGLYAPGGRAPLPSTVLMLGVPAALAGCDLRILCTPPRADGSVDPAILAAAHRVGIQRVFRVGGAQAIAAMAYGTAALPRVDKIFGPGSVWVTHAKTVCAQDPEGAAADLPAGPSEVLVLADAGADPDVVAVDLLSQAEHGEDSQVVLVSPSVELIAAVQEALARQLEALPRRAVARAALRESVAVLVADLGAGLEVANRYAPEHLILNVAEPEPWLGRVRNAGSVFVGRLTPESAGDYASGTNHVLPTYGLARSTSGLSLDDFSKQVTFQELTAEGLEALGPTIETLAGLEGLDAHGLAVRMRRRALRGERAP